MKLTAQNYETLIKNTASQLIPFTTDRGTSISYQYMRDVCNRLIEIANEYQIEFPKEFKRFSDG